MSINATVGSSASGTKGTGTSSSQATGATTAVSHALSKADQRIQADVDATTAQLSSFGLLKSAVSGSQIAAQALTGLKSGASASSITQTMAAFFNAFNAANQAAQTTSAVPGSSIAAQSASRVSRDLKWSLSSGATTSDAMRKLGLKLQSNGSLTQDPKTFAAALSKDPDGVRAAMATLGKQVNAVATKELATGGSVAATVANLTQHGSALAAQQKAMLTLEQAMASGQSSTSATATSGSGTSGAYTGLGLSAYLANIGA